METREPSEKSVDITSDTLSQHWHSLLKPLFPSHAYIRSLIEPANMTFAIDWRLGTDKKRPYKRSRLIKIVFPKQTMEQFLHQALNQRESSEQIVVNHLKDKLQKYNPDHDTPPIEVPPVEEWLIDIGTLKSR